MSGARALVEQGSRPGRHAVIGEPTGLRPVRMHKGIMMESFQVRGHSGHSSDPSLAQTPPRRPEDRALVTARVDW